jgi:hypothetical protein
VKDAAATKRAALAQRIQDMPPPERLRFAALLLEAGKVDLAHAIISNIADELYALKMGGEW